MRRGTILLFAGSLLLLLAPGTSTAVPQAQSQEDIWAPFRFFVGSWEGHGEGGPGSGLGEQTFEFMLRGKYLQARNRTVFAPQEKNPSGEVHEDMGIFSYDKARKLFILRQFHVEGFVNRYALEPQSADGRTFVFVTEAIENIPPGFRARLTYRIVDADTFEQTFDLAAPGKEFECYSTGVMKRRRKP